MKNEEWNKTQNDAPFVAVPDEMANVSIAGLQWFILIPRLNHTGSHRPIDSHSISYLQREKKYRIWNKNYPACCNPTNYEESSHSHSSRSRKIVCESRINEIKHVQNEKPLREFTHKYHRKKKDFRPDR